MMRLHPSAVVGYLLSRGTLACTFRYNELITVISNQVQLEILPMLQCNTL